MTGETQKVAVLSAFKANCWCAVTAKTGEKKLSMILIKLTLMLHAF